MRGAPCRARRGAPPARRRRGGRRPCARWRRGRRRRRAPAGGRGGAGRRRRARGARAVVGGVVRRGGVPPQARGTAKAPRQRARRRARGEPGRREHRRAHLGRHRLLELRRAVAREAEVADLRVGRRAPEQDVGLEVAVEHRGLARGGRRGRARRRARRAALVAIPLPRAAASEPPGASSITNTTRPESTCHETPWSFATLACAARRSRSSRRARRLEVGGVEARPVHRLRRRGARCRRRSTAAWTIPKEPWPSTSLSWRSSSSMRVRRTSGAAVRREGAREDGALPAETYWRCESTCSGAAGAAERRERRGARRRV